MHYKTYSKRWTKRRKNLGIMGFGLLLIASILTWSIVHYVNNFINTI